MRFFVGITDRDWFDFLSRLKGLDEVNFWQPSGQQPNLEGNSWFPSGPLSDHKSRIGPWQISDKHN